MSPKQLGSSGRCRLCGKSPVQLVDAHIIPTSLYGDAVKDPRGPAKLMTNTKGVFPKRSHTGIYEKNIVCEPCEARFSPWDDHASQVFIKSEPEPIRHGKEIVGYLYGTPDYRKLKLFFISLIWRMHWSSNPYFDGVNLSRTQEKQVRSMILDTQPGNPDQYSVVVSRFTNELPAFVHPFHERYDGIGVYRVHFWQHSVLVKVTTMKFEADRRRFQLTPGQDLIALSTEFGESNEIDVLRKVLTEAYD